jgi:hypothetical protein
MKPKFNIKYGKLIDPFFKDSVSIKYPDYEFPTEEKIQEKIKLFKKAWEEKSDTFINFLYKETGLEFKRNVIDCFIVSATPRDMSAPLIIRSRYNEEEFLDTMYHELIHILFSDNKVSRDESFKNESIRVQNHIALHALLKKFYLEVLNDEVGFKRIYDKSSDEKNKEYRRAWDIVDEIGVDEIIKLYK